jgi:predicted GNAT family N-acyltransferase
LKKEKMIYLNAQKPVIDFYAKLGFDARGDIFLEAEIPHQKMVFSH